MRLSVLIFIALTSRLAFGETLEPLRMRLPIDGDAIQAKCAIAYQQLQKDRLDKEAQEGFTCLATLPSPDLQTVESGFMIRCERAAELRTLGARGEAVLETEDLKTAYFQDYSPLISARCGESEHRRISAYNASHSSSQGAGQARREGCYYLDRCL